MTLPRSRSSSPCSPRTSTIRCSVKTPETSCPCRSRSSAYFDLTNALAHSQPDLPRSAVMIILLLAAVLIAAAVFITPAVLDVVLR